MQGAKWFRAGIAGLILLCTCSALPSVAAQEPAPDIDNEEDEKITPALIITATLNENGSLTLMTYALGQTELSSDLKPALEAAFRCAFKDAGSHKLNTASYFAKCQLPASGSGLLHEYRFATALLRNYALHDKLELLSIQLTLPDTEVRETAPPTKGFDFSQRRIPEKTRRHFDAVRSFSWRVDSSAIPESVLVRVGYDSAAVQRRTALLLSALLLPILLAFWLRRRALNARVADKPSVWFSYIRCQQWLLNGSLVAWSASTETAHLSGHSSLPAVNRTIATYLDSFLRLRPGELDAARRPMGGLHGHISACAGKAAGPKLDAQRACPAGYLFALLGASASPADNQGFRGGDSRRVPRSNGVLSCCIPR
jgi:hypothetical protein